MYVSHMHAMTFAWIWNTPQCKLDQLISATPHLPCIADDQSVCTAQCITLELISRITDGDGSNWLVDIYDHAVADDFLRMGTLASGSDNCCDDQS